MTNNIHYPTLTMDEIIFIDRNQSYGAFDIRQSYPDHIKRAIIGMLTLFISLLGYQRLSAFIHPARQVAIVDITAHPTEIPKEMLDFKKPKIEPPRGTPEAATANFAEMKASNHDADSLTPVEYITPEVELSNHATAGPAGPKGDPEGPSVIDMHVSAPPKESAPVDFAEYMPEYPGGVEALLGVITRNTEYPEIDKEMNRQGTVVVGFVIDEAGNVTDRQIVKSASATMDREALRVVGLLKTFKPGSQSGHAVKVRFKLPIRYRLNNGE